MSKIYKLSNYVSKCSRSVRILLSKCSNLNRRICHYYYEVTGAGRGSGGDIFFVAENLSLCSKSVSVKSNLPKSVICRPSLFREPILVGKPEENSNICRR